MTGKMSVRWATGRVSQLASQAAAQSGCSGAYPCMAVTLRWLRNDGTKSEPDGSR